MFQISLGNDTAEDFSIQEGDRIGLGSNGKYEIVEKPDGVIIKSITKMKLLLANVNYDEMISEGVDLFVQPV